MNTTISKAQTAKGIKTAQLNANVFQYIIDCIDSDGYEITTNTDVEKLQFLADTFQNEYSCKENLQYYKSFQNMFANWVMGLPSSFNVDYENYKIIEIAKKWGSIPGDADDRQEDKIIDNWFLFIATKTEQLCRKHGIVLFKLGAK